MDYCCSACSVPFSLFFRLILVGDVLQNFLEDDFDLLTWQLGDYICQVFNGFRLYGVIFRLDLFHEGLLDGGGGLLFSFKVYFSGDDEFG